MGGHIRWRAWGLATLGLAALVCFGFRAVGDEHEGRVVLQFDTMTGNPGNGNPANVIRGLQGGGVPWVILHSVHGELTRSGKLHVRVRGLVIPIAPFDNSNPVGMFRAALSCQDPIDANNGQLFFTNLFPATTGAGAGDADIDGQVQLPDSCLAPIVLITSPPSTSSPDGAWFAATGFPVATHPDHDGDSDDGGSN